MEPLTVPGTLDSLDAIRNHVRAAATSAGLNRSATYRLVIAVDEVASNIVIHGYDAAGITGMVDVRVHVDDRTVTIAVEDRGTAYIPTIQPLDELDLPRDDREIGGLGLFLARRNVDVFRYERIDDRNVHTFVVYRETP